jgi:hypothetical protein
MIALILLLLISVASGLPVAMMLDRSLRGAGLVGSGLLIGMAVLATELFVLSVMSVSWSRVTLFAATVVIGTLFWTLALRGGRVPPLHGGLRPSLLVDFATGVVVGGHLLFATAAPVAENDFMTIWGLKAKTFWFHGGIDFEFLASPWSVLFHVDYPLLLPLIYDVFAVLNGGWDDRWLGGVTTLFGLGGLLLIRAEAERETGSPWIGSFLTLGMSGVVLSPWIGLAEGPLAAYIVGGCLLIRRGAGVGDPSAIRLGAVLLGCAALTKNEGLTMIVAAALGVAIATLSFRTALLLWPAVAITLPWLIVRAIHGLRTDLWQEGALDRIAARVLEPAELLQPLSQTWLGRPLLFVALTAAFVIGVKRIAKSEQFLMIAIIVQLGFYLLAYLASPHDVAWHVTWSWERLVSHLLPLVVLVVSMQMVGMIRSSAEGRMLPSSPGSQ